MARARLRLPAIHVIEHLIDRQHPFFAVLVFEDRVIPAAHGDRSQRVLTDAETLSGAELPEHAFVLRSRESLRPNC